MDVVARETRFVTGPLGGARRRRRLVGPHRVRRVPGHAGRRRARLGHADAWPAARVGIAGVGKVGRHLVGHLLEDGADRGRHRRVRGRRSSAVRAAHPRSRSSTTPTRWCGPTSTSTRRARSAARSPTRWWPCCGPRWSAAAPTTSSPTPASRSCWPSAASSTRPTTCVNAGGVIQVADEMDGFYFERARAKAAAIFDTTAPGLAARRRRGRAAGGGRRPAGRAADGRGRPPRRLGPVATRSPGVERRTRSRAGTACGHVPLAPTEKTRDPGPPRAGRPVTYEGVEPWGAAGPRPSRPRSPAS